MRQYRSMNTTFVFDDIKELMSKYFKCAIDLSTPISWLWYCIMITQDVTVGEKWVIYEFIIISNLKLF